MKTQIILILFFFITTGVGGWLFNKERIEKKRLKANQESLMGEVERWRTKDSLNVLSNTRLLLKKNELEDYNSELVERVKSQGIKIKRLQSVTQTGTKTETIIKTEVKDSLIYVDNVVVDTFRCVDYISPYLDLKGCFGNNEFNGSIVSRDTLIQAVFRVPKQFLFIKWGTKGIRQTIMSANPFTEIQYNEYIELK